MNSKYWADKEAKRVIHEFGDREKYVCASGITPSGTVHIGNFREIITVDLVVKALQDMGKKTRFIYSWDSFDRLRKIPGNIKGEERKKMEEYIGMPVWDAADPFGCHKNYALHWMTPVVEDVKELGIKPDFMNQGELYRTGIYAEGIRKALRQKNTIMDILNPFRKTLLPESWWPASIYCEKCNKDFTEITDYNGEYSISYKCKCGNENVVDFRKRAIIKLKWRIDWPMRWEYYGVNFEPGGKDHFIAGSSYDTGINIAKHVYGKKAPYGFMYEFVGLKGVGGKMSGSVGNVYSVREVMEVYLPEVVRYLFAGTSARSAFDISFDADAIKYYEDFYEHERVYFGEKEVGERDEKHMRRVYELSAIEIPEKLPVQPSLRLMSDTVQTYKTKKRAVEYLIKNKLPEAKSSFDKKRLQKMSQLAENWVLNHAPDSFRYELKAGKLDKEEKEIVGRLIKMLEKKEYKNAEEIKSDMFLIAKEIGMKKFFQTVYKALFNKKQGPKLNEYVFEQGQKSIVQALKKSL